MSEHELNKAIAEALGLRITQEHMTEGYVHVWNDNDFIKRIPDYCNNWSDLMPLVVEHGISLSPLDDGDWAAIKNQVCASINENPQLAACECLLKVLKAKGE